MQLNLPIVDRLSRCKSILVAGMGGGFDVFSGLPIYFELEHQGMDVHLASLSFSDIVGLDEGETLTDTLVGVTADLEGHFDYFPEFFLAQWFYEERNDEVTIWCFEKSGGRPLIKDYAALIEHLGIDAILLVDGGVDSLMHGDEPEMGTLFEDSLSLLAVSELQQVPVRLTACLGLGIEAEVGYAHLFENIATLTRQGAFLGTCALVREMDCYRRYEDAVVYVFDQQPQYPSVICASVISAVRGHYGNYHLTNKTKNQRLNISPLMPIYWFFEAPAVARHNRLLSSLRVTYSVEEAWKAMQAARAALPLRDTPAYPLP